MYNFIVWNSFVCYFKGINFTPDKRWFIYQTQTTLDFLVKVPRSSVFNLQTHIQLYTAHTDSKPVVSFPCAVRSEGETSHRRRRNVEKKNCGSQTIVLLGRVGNSKNSDKNKYPVKYAASL